MSQAREAQKVIFPVPLTRWLDLHRQAGLSYAAIAERLKDLGVPVSNVTVWRWCTGRVNTDVSLDCPHGHPRTRENWRRDRSGHHYCHPCRLRRNADYRRRKNQNEE